jgi:hypothetical protein
MREIDVSASLRVGRYLLLLLLASGAAAIENTGCGSGATCLRTSDCSDGYSCQRGQCIMRVATSSSSDAGDAGSDAEDPFAFLDASDGSQ